MKSIHALGTLGTVGLLSFGAWLGCSSSSSSPTPATDGGTHPDSGNTTPDAGTHPDTGSPFPDSAVPPPNDGGSVTDAGVPTVSCQTYCQTVTTACAGPNAQYALTAPHAAPDFSVMQQCLSACANMTPGTYGETADSVGCRQYHADNAAKSASAAGIHCPHAGMYGGDLCGKRCDDFCSLAVQLCSTANGNAQQWNDIPSCVTDCTTKYPYDPDAGQFDPADFNHINCFEYHLREAYTDPDAAEPNGGITVAQSHCLDLVVAGSPTPSGTCSP